jgi:SAM-dependent methyltransferase/ADP-ribose pyrophosphatase YjhB (NUDIX family)
MSATEHNSPAIIAAALFERDDQVLAAHRRPDRPPFAGQWLLPMTVVAPHETAEEAVRRHAREQFGVTTGAEVFVDTVYMEDPDRAARYVTNIFRATLTGGPMRFRADGDYDDARWLAAPDLEQLWMPPALREPLVRIISEPHDEATVAAQQAANAAAEATPLAEREEPQPDDAPAPDNVAGWEAISAAYQRERYGDRDVGRLKWSWGVYEDDLRLLDDVRGLRALVIGCGGGQDAVALERMGARTVGVDVSGEQIAYAKKYALRHGAANASFLRCDATDLSRFDDESFDLAVSIHALGYVEDATRALSEAARVLSPGGVFAFAVPHPFDSVASDDGPVLRIERSYWATHLDWEWSFADGTHARFRDYARTVSSWFDMLIAAGFAVERIVEPRQDAADDDVSDEFRARAALLPYVLIIKARKR